MGVKKRCRYKEKAGKKRKRKKAAQCSVEATELTVQQNNEREAKR